MRKRVTAIAISLSSALRCASSCLISLSRSLEFATVCSHAACRGVPFIARALVRIAASDPFLVGLPSPRWKASVAGAPAPAHE